MTSANLAHCRLVGSLDNAKSREQKACTAWRDALKEAKACDGLRLGSVLVEVGRDVVNGSGMLQPVKSANMLVQSATSSLEERLNYPELAGLASHCQTACRSHSLQ